MMFHGLGRIGDDNSENAQKLATPFVTPIISIPKSNPNADLSQCEWCANHPTLATFSPSCWNLNEQICSPITQAWVTGGAPAAPPSQDFIDTHTPDEVIDDILRRTQQNAMDAATKAAAEQGSYLPPTAPVVGGPCVKDSPQYSAIMCFLSQNSGAIFGLGLAAAAIAFLMPAKKGR